MIPFVVQGVKCFFYFNLILATGKHSAYSESITLKKVNVCFIGVDYQLLIIINEIIKVNGGMSEQIIKVEL